MKCDKTRNRKGQWCLTETSRYKMNRHLGGFNEEAEAKFNELALDKYDFARCQRSDGTFYGTGGKCRKGTETGAKEKPEKKVRKKKDKKSSASDVTGGKLTDAGFNEKSLDQAFEQALGDKKNWGTVYDVLKEVSDNEGRSEEAIATQFAWTLQDLNPNFLKGREGDVDDQFLDLLEEKGLYDKFDKMIDQIEDGTIKVK